MCYLGLLRLFRVYLNLVSVLFFGTFQYVKHRFEASKLATLSINYEDDVSEEKFLKLIKVLANFVHLFKSFNQNPAKCVKQIRTGSVGLIRNYRKRSENLNF